MKLEQNFANKIIDFLTDEFNNGYNTKNQKSFISYMENSLKNGFKTSWSLGGTTGDCYGETRQASAEMETDLTHLDDFIMSQYPQISFMQYKMIERAVSKDVKNDSDWYGGKTQTASKEISFSVLSDVAVKVKLEQGNAYVNVMELVAQKAQMLFPEPVKETKQEATDFTTELEQKPVKKYLGIADEKKIRMPKEITEKATPKATKKM